MARVSLAQKYEGIAQHLAHITAAEGAGASSLDIASSTDCFYVALLEARRTAGDPPITASMVADLRARVANQLDTDDTCRVFHKNWSMNGEVKGFAGYSTPQRAKRARGWADDYDNFVDQLAFEAVKGYTANRSRLKYSANIGMLAALEYGRPWVDLLRLGEGFEGGTIRGFVDDTIRGITIALPGAGLVPKRAGVIAIGERTYGLAVGEISRAAFYYKRYQATRAIEKSQKNGKFDAKAYTKLIQHKTAFDGSGMEQLSRKTFSFHKKVTIPGAGPGGMPVEIRAHSVNPKAPEGTRSRVESIMRITSGRGSRQYELMPEKGGWVQTKKLSVEDFGLAHRTMGG